MVEHLSLEQPNGFGLLLRPRIDIVDARLAEVRLVAGDDHQRGILMTAEIAQLWSRSWNIR